MPILKQRTASQSKRHSRADLTTEMISAPLGDFRHTMHVGRGGDAFGDTSFLSTRSGEPPKEPAPELQPSSLGPAPKPGLLSRTFRSSKRSQSVNRGDKYVNNLSAPPGSSPTFVKNAISLPYLNNEDAGRIGGGHPMAKSVSSSPLKILPEVDAIRKPVNGAAALATMDMEFNERDFGELTDLPPSYPRGGGMKHAESIMSFHVDLGPSMLGDILSVMEKKGWEEDDLGYEEGKCSEGHGSPTLSPPTTEDEDQVDTRPPARPPRSAYHQQKIMAEPPYTPPRNHYPHRHMDSCSVSSSGSAALEEKPLYVIHDGDTDSAKYSSPGGRGVEDRDFSFMDDDDDEIRV